MNPPWRLAPLAAALAAAAPAWAQQAPASTASAAAHDLPVTLEADSLSGRPDLEASAEGHVRMRRGPVAIRADRVHYDAVSDTARATGQVHITRDGDWFRGPELQLQLQRFEGFFLQPDYFLSLTGAGGHADRVDFDLETNEGEAEGAVLRFYGVPILGAPRLSFPLNDDRKSGWLPPTFDLNSKSGFELSVPYYWNIAPNRDATLAPIVITKRGVGVQTEFRYLEPNHRGELQFDVLPDDRVAGQTRHGLQLQHDGQVVGGVHVAAQVLRVSDDDYWKDFRRLDSRVLTQRLLPVDLLAERRFGDGNGLDLRSYARVQRWQVLQADDAPIAPPYQRSPQVGLAGTAQLGGWWEFAFEGEVNRFTLQDKPTGIELDALTGERAHLLASLSLPWRTPGTWLVPKLAVNVASYHTDQAMDDGRHDVTRTIPTFSVDGGLLFERDASWFGRAWRQTLEPRLLYVNTPYERQRDLPIFDSAAKDFNDISVYSDNLFTGVDRVSDAHQLTAGVTTRLLDDGSGVERIRFGVAQRYLFRDQRVTSNPDGTPDGDTFTQRLSDLLLLGSASFNPHWSLDASTQYNSEIDRFIRSVVTARWSPGPFRTLATSYRLARGQNEQLDVGWQWPLYQAAPQRSSGSCSGSLYTVGRVNYSMKDSRVTDSLVGFEYDAGCWIGRIVAERLSTGRAEATTRLLFQLELVGLSRLGSNPLKVLKDNIPGYQLLRDERGQAPLFPAYD